MASCRSFCFVLAMAVAPATVKSQVDVTLLKLESDPMMLYGAGITTVQFYEGDLEQGALDLKARLMEVAKLNPWIGSHLVKQPPMVAMRYDEEMFPVDDVFEINMNMKLREDMPYNEMTKAGSSVEVDTGNGVNRLQQPIYTFVAKLTPLAEHLVDTKLCIVTGDELPPQLSAVLRTGSGACTDKASNFICGNCGSIYDQRIGHQEVPELDVHP